MSLPSDVNPDIPPTATPPRSHLLPRGRNHMTAQQQGWIVAALVAFLGVAYIGPAIARYRRKPSLRQRMSRRLDDTKRQVRGAGVKVRRRVRRLGGGPIWR